MKVKIKKLNKDAVTPIYAKEGDAGMDITATSMKVDDYGNIEYGTGLAMEIPEGYMGLLFPRSSNSKKDLLLSNSVGVIDSGYRGEIKIKFKGGTNLDKSEIFNNDDEKIGEIVIERNKLQKEVYRVGERIAQLIIMPYPKVEFEEVDNLTETERGDGGFGSTGKQ